MNKLTERDCIDGLIDRARNGAVDRRTFIKAMGFMASLPLAMRMGVSWAGTKRLVVVNWGGDSKKDFNIAWGKTFAAETGIDVKIDGSGPSPGAIKTQYASGNSSWDVMDVYPFSTLTLGPQGILSPIDYSVVDKDKVRNGMTWKYGVCNYLVSYVLAYDASVYGKDAPRTWKDFWDVERFPQPRTTYKWMQGVLESALLADGVAPEDLYPLDVERAFAKVERLKPYILAFWGTGAMSQQLMLSGQTPLGMVWNTRAMLMTKESDERIRWTYDRGFVVPDAWAVMANNRAGPETAMQFIAFTQDPNTQVALFKLQGNAPANPEADALIPKSMRHLNGASPENMAKQIRVDTEWYADYYATTLEKFLALISS